MTTAAAFKPQVRARRIRFDYPVGSMNQHYVQGDLVMSHIVSVLSAVFPEGEDFFVRSVRYYAPQVTEPALKTAVAGFIGQEVTHGREHRQLNERLQQMGFPTRRIDRVLKVIASIAYQRLPKLTSLAITAALEHYTATLAETLLGDERAQEVLGDSEVRSMLLWHAVEESEHKAVAFDVYRTVGGSERRRIATMRAMTFGFIGFVGLESVVSMITDRATYHPVRLVRSVRAALNSPFLAPNVRATIRAYNKPGFHPDDHDNSELLARWTAQLFGEQGLLADHLR